MPNPHDADTVRHALASFVTERYLAERQRPLAADERLVSLGVIDSLGLLDLTAFVEEEFDVLLTPDRFGSGRIDSLDDLVAVVSREAGAKR